MAKIFSNPNLFQIGNVTLEIPPEDISWTRIENHQTLDWLRSEGTMKIPSGRSSVRIDVRAKFPIGELHSNIDILKSLVAITRTAPFVPIRNQYLFDHLPLLGRETERDGSSFNAGDSLPCVVFGLSVIVGGDSPEVVEARMTFMYWNPAPFMGLEALAWHSRASHNIATESSRYLTQIDKVLNDATRPVNVPASPQETRIVWYNLATYNELKERFGVHDQQLTEDAAQVSTEGWKGWGDAAIQRNDHYLSMPDRALAQRIVESERNLTQDDLHEVSLDPQRNNEPEPVPYLIRRYYNVVHESLSPLNRARAINKAKKEWAAGRDVSNVPLKRYLTNVLDIDPNRRTEPTPYVESERPENPNLTVDPKTNRIVDPIPNPVDMKHEKTFKKGTETQPGGWYKVDRNNIQALNPIFRQQGQPRVITLTPQGLRKAENQVVTGLTITFQNKFSLIPMQGYPYPAVQHLGARDSEVVLAVACMSPVETYPALQGTMQMLHDMAKRAVDFRGNLYTGPEIHAVTEMRVENRILNQLGLANFIVTAVDNGRDPEAPELVRMTISLTENNVVDEEFRGFMNFSDNGYNTSLFDFLTSGEWQSEMGHTPGLQADMKTLEACWKVAELAHQKNKDDILKQRDQVAIGLESLTVPDKVQNFGRHDGTRIVEGAWVAPTTPDGKVLTKAFKHIPMRSSWPFPEFDPSENITDPYLTTVAQPLDKGEARFNYLPVVLDRSKMLGSDFGNTVLEALNFWVGNLDTDDPGLVRYTEAIGGQYLQTTAGKRLLDSSALMRRLFKKFDNESLNPREQLTGTIRNAALEYLEAWNDAHFEWYRDYQVKRVLYQLAMKYPDAFAAVNQRYGEQSETKVGCYRDLFLGNPAQLNQEPYQWLDAVAISHTKEQINRFADGTKKYAEAVRTFALKEAQDETAEKKAYYIDRKAMYGDQDHPAVTKEWQGLVEEAKKGRVQYYNQSQLFKDAGSSEEIIRGIRDIQPTQFTVRRCFPTFKLFFVEEDDKGIIRGFNEFYNYNAIMSWALHEHTNRPSTLTCTMTNLFNHLDAVILSDLMKDEDKDKVLNAGRTAGYNAVYQREVAGRNIEGTGQQERDLQNIMLKPGAKVVLKAGYSNHPDKLTTVFAGQVTDITPGDVMTIVCQDWTSELLVPWDPDYGKSGIDEVGWIESTFTDNETDITGTKGTWLMLYDILGQLSSRHLGGFYIGASNPYVIHSHNWVQWRAAQKAMKQGYGAGDRAMTNVRPTQMPFFSAFGISDEMKEVPYQGRYNWEIIQALRKRHCNNITFVRPYGQGDGTLYFGPPWGTYTTRDTMKDHDPRLWQMDTELGYEAFKKIIDKGITVDLNDVDFAPSANRVEFKRDRWWIGRLWEKGAHSVNPNRGAGAGRPPIHAVLADYRITKELFRATGDASKWWSRLEAETGSLVNPDTFGSHPDTTQNFLAKWMRPNGREAVIRLYYDALRVQGFIQPGSKRLGRSNDAAIELLRRTHSEILSLIKAETVRDAQAQLASGTLDEDDFDLVSRFVSEVRDINQSVRKWHVVTSKHHIVANNITVNNNYANAIAIQGEDEVFVQFDPGLDDKRVKIIRDHADIKDSAIRGFTAVSMLRDEMRKMYRGEIILTGNPEIRPHDILVISDDIRQIFGIVEVDKVIHSMDTQNGFISIVTPALVCEAGDMTLSHAYQAFYSQLSSDLSQLQQHGALGNIIARIQSIRFSPLNLGDVKATTEDMADASADPDSNQGLATTVGGGLTATAGLAGIGTGAYLTGSALAVGTTLTALTLPFGLILAGGLLLGTGIAYFGLQNMALKEHIRTHPITITPLSKRGWPWLAGIDGALGYTMVGQWGKDAVKGWNNVTETLNTIKRAQVLINSSRATGESLDDFID